MRKHEVRTEDDFRSFLRNPNRDWSRVILLGLDLRAADLDDALLIEVSLMPGRTAEKKEALFRAIVGNLGRSPGIRPEDLCIVLYEPPVENWAEHGERFAAPPG